VGRPALLCALSPLRPLCCRSPDSTFAEVLDKLVHNRLHRVYVCTEGLVPAGVITLTDILRKLVEM
jgi:CBS domain-containing protein